MEFNMQDSELKRFIAEAGLVSKRDLLAAEVLAMEEGRTLADALLAGGYLEEDDLRRVESYVLGIPFVSLKDTPIDFEILSLIPEPLARNHNLAAYRKTDKGLEVAILSTTDLPALDFLKQKDIKVLPRLTDTGSIREALLQYQRRLKDRFGDIIVDEARALNKFDASKSTVEKIANLRPAVRLVDTVLRHAVTQDASDIHIEPNEDEILIRYRIDGLLHDAMTLPSFTAKALTARIKLIASLDLDERRLPQNGRFKMEMDGQKMSLRVSTLPTAFGEKIVMRLIKQNRSGFTLEGIGFHNEALEQVHQAMQPAGGLILVTGPGDSGKTTTLYTLVDLLNTPAVNISTIEDPIEYQMPRVNQTQTKPDIGLTFATGLRTLLRQDPDVIMIGEINDEETARLAINAALTGHKVLAGITADSTANAITRLLSMDIEPFLLSACLRLVVGQRLARRLTDQKENYTLDSEERKELEEEANLAHVLDALRTEKIVKKNDTWSAIPFYRPASDTGDDEGYQGRIGLQEVLSISPTIKELIVKNGTEAELIKPATKDGMLTLTEDGIYKAAQGITSLEEVLRVMSE